MLHTISLSYKKRIKKLSDHIIFGYNFAKQTQKNI